MTSVQAQLTQTHDANKAQSQIIRREVTHAQFYNLRNCTSHRIQNKSFDATPVHIFPLNNPCLRKSSSLKTSAFLHKALSFACLKCVQSLERGGGLWHFGYRGTFVRRTCGKLTIQMMRQTVTFAWYG